VGQLWRGVAVVLPMALAIAAPPTPAPPPNPSDQQLQQSGDAVSAHAAQVAQLTGRLAALDDQADDLEAALAGKREDAEGALADYQAAEDAADQAQKQADQARAATDGATAAIDAARAKLDDFLTSTYQQGPDLGPIGLLTTATSPDDLIARAQLGDLVAQQQKQVQDSLERARVDKANADSAARAALDTARERQTAAQHAKVAADSAVAAATSAAQAQQTKLAAVASQRAGVQQQLDAAENADAGLRAQRSAFDAWQAQQAAAAAASAKAARDAAAKRVSTERPTSAGAPGAVQAVIDRAMSQLGVQYVWGGGSPRGPTTGIPDGLGSPLNLVGFDCSGLMMYAFAGAGITLPRVARNQFNAGTKIPISQVRPGDMIFYQDPGGPIHHVAMYIGNNKMIEAPYTGADVRVTTMRTKGLLPQATRMF
jgi:peptidoglycan DL-endopeptidase RipA